MIPLWFPSVLAASSNQGGSWISGHWFWVLVGVAVYFVPTIVAAQRLHPRRIQIALVNVFLGWTFLGWVGSLLWASWNFNSAVTPSKSSGIGEPIEQPKRDSVDDDTPGAGWYPDPEGPGERYWTGDTWGPRRD